MHSTLEEIIIVHIYSIMFVEECDYFFFLFDQSSLFSASIKAETNKQNETYCKSMIFFDLSPYM